MTETIDFHPTGDVVFDHLMQEVNAEIQATNDFILPDEMVASAVDRACKFFHLPEAPIINSAGSCVWPNDPGTPFDDVFGFNRKELMEMGIQGEDSLTLVYTHECAHRALQSYNDLDPWEHELACDFFAGIHAGMKGIGTSNFEEALGNTQGSSSHPTGSLRADFIEYGKDIVHEMQARHVPVTFEGCLERFNAHLIEEEATIAQCREAADNLITPKTGEEHPLGITEGDYKEENDDLSQISFGLKYSDAEISKMKSDVERAEYEVSCRRNDVSNWESKVSLNDNEEHRANGDYAHAVSRLNEAKSRYNHAVDELNNAKRKLNSAT